MAKAKKRQNRKAAQLTAVKERRPVLAPSEAPPVKEKRGRGRPRKRTRGPPRQGGQATEGVFLTERQAPVTDVVPQAAGQSHAPTHEQRRQQSPSPGPNILTQPPPKTVLEDLPALVDNTVVSLMFKLEEARRLLDNSTDVTQIRYLMGMVNELAQAITTVKSIPL